jgi:hypothetical protein
MAGGSEAAHKKVPQAVREGGSSRTSIRGNARKPKAGLDERTAKKGRKSGKETEVAQKIVQKYS